MATQRSRESVEEAKLPKVKERQQRANRRARKIPASQYDARNAQKVLIGEQLVPELKDSEEAIGSMDTICVFCGAKNGKMKHHPCAAILVKFTLTHSQILLISYKNY